MSAIKECEVEKMIGLGQTDDHWRPKATDGIGTMAPKVLYWLAGKGKKGAWQPAGARLATLMDGL